MRVVFREFLKPIEDLKKNKFIIILMISLSLTVTILNVYSPILVKNIIDLGIMQKNIVNMYLYITLLLVSSIVSAILDYIINIFNKKISNDYVILKRKEVLYTLDNRYIKDIDKISIGKIMRLLNNDIPLLANFLTYNIYSILSDVITAIFAIFVLIYIDFKLFIVTTLLQIILIYFSKLIDKRTEKLVLSINNNSDLFNLKMSDILSKINYLILTNFYKKQANKLGEISNDILYEEYNLEKLEGINYSISSILQSFIMIVIYLYCGIKIINNGLTIGELLMFTMYSNRYINPIARLIQMKVSLIQASESIRRVYNFINLDGENNYNHKENSLDGDIIFSNITFSYDSYKIFDKNNFKVLKGNINLIKGKSGTGKTTLLKILLGMLELESGNIYISNENIKSIDVKYLRDNISYVSQKTEIFYDTLRNNINIAENANITDTTIIESLKSVGLGENMAEDKELLNEILLNDGKNISGGEAQRLALCRAIVQDRKIIILDEVTANLDKKTEDDIVSLIYDNFKNKTVIIITHSDAFDKIAHNIIKLR
ncbi:MULTISPECIES: ABC transporter ATP-binding protein [Peptoniphilus]|uniref:ABC transporter ATP-binding protein n=2 Tax=Peptoniphilaceae TaxID=1570339 RepID=UPI0029019578|nr:MULTISPECIES: ABC transporter ATP-binding protein [Peptoniphilus]MDU1043868.1 ABC transporter ATP-binding protein [Peptoniphilus rhinitidis]MDU5275463.1 ABC transporter ATP-binding protein [Peptoniphilus lacydonensis]MDU5377702.1 ABC transporter ATP-binding protein [Peptoniphilus lacydonensis]